MYGAATTEDAYPSVQHKATSADDRLNWRVLHGKYAVAQINSKDG